MVKDFSAKLVSKENLAGNVWGFRFEVIDETLEFAPGQYLLLKIDGQYRQYSISSSNVDTQHFDLIVEFFEGGLASTYLDNLQIGETAEFKGPAGIFVFKDTGRKKIFLVTGTGIAPVKSMIDSYLETGGTDELNLFFGLKTRSDMYLLDHFSELKAQHANLSCDICLSREENLDGLDENVCSIGRVNQVCDVFIEESGTSYADYDFYLCGSQQIVESLKEFVLGKGVPAEQVYFENFGAAKTPPAQTE